MFSHLNWAKDELLETYSRIIKEGADTVVKDVRKETNGLATIKAWNCDISDPKAVRDCAEEIRREFGMIYLI